jgi:hypothetical protein
MGVLTIRLLLSIRASLMEANEYVACRPVHILNEYILTFKTFRHLLSIWGRSWRSMNTWPAGLHIFWINIFWHSRLSGTFYLLGTVLWRSMNTWPVDQYIFWINIFWHSKLSWLSIYMGWLTIRPLYLLGRPNYQASLSIRDG